MHSIFVFFCNLSENSLLQEIKHAMPKHATIVPTLSVVSRGVQPLNWIRGAIMEISFGLLNKQNLNQVLTHFVTKSNQTIIKPKENQNVFKRQPKTNQKRIKIEPKENQNVIKRQPKSNQKRTKIESKDNQNRIKIEPKSSQNEFGKWLCVVKTLFDCWKHQWQNDIQYK